MSKKITRAVAVILTLFVASSLIISVFAYTTTPKNIRSPQSAHVHFRIQILVNGQAEDFSQDKYQQGYAKDQCTADLPDAPVHFHDNRDQMVHIHWRDTTGGEVLKYYGWNKIGGLPNYLGIRFKDPTRINLVKIHGNMLPQVPKDTNFYVYTGDENTYQKRNLTDFLSQDLETFFGKTYDNHSTSSLLDLIVQPVLAHGGENHSEGADSSDEEKLETINTLIGNIVIFVQAQEPTDDQIKDRFNKLMPLTESTCGG